MPQIIGIVPARYGSTRFPGKPLIPILGKSLIQRTVENAQRAKLDQIIVATDDQRIYDHVRGFGGQVVMTSVDCMTGTDRLADVLQNHPDYLTASVIVNIQGDEPCVDPEAINAICKGLLDDPTAVMCTAVTSIKSEEEALSPSIVKCVADKNGNALYFSRALIPSNKKNAFNHHGSYLRHIGIYAYRPSFILTYQKLTPTPLQMEEDLEQLKILEHGYRIKVAMIQQNSPGVDTPEDISKVEEWIHNQNIFL